MKASDRAVVRAEAKLDYLEGMTFRELAAKYGVAVGTISYWAKVEQWPIEQYRNTPPKKLEQELNAVQEANMDREAEDYSDYELLRETALKALKKINDLLDLDEALAPRDIKSITSSLLDLKGQLNALSPRELREQAARLRSLEKQSEQPEAASETIEVEFINTEGADA